MTPKATQFLDRIASWAQNRDDVNLILLLGSQARADDPADQFSDVDIVLGCLEPRRYLDNGDWIGALDTPLLTFVEPTATGGELERRVLFANGLDVDVSLIAMATLRLWAAEGMPPDVLPVIRRGMRAVLDREGLAPRLSAQAGSSPPIAAVPSEGEFAERTHDFLVSLPVDGEEGGPRRTVHGTTVSRWTTSEAPFRARAHLRQPCRRHPDNMVWRAHDRISSRRRHPRKARRDLRHSRPNVDCGRAQRQHGPARLLLPRDRQAARIHLSARSRGKRPAHDREHLVRRHFPAPARALPGRVQREQLRLAAPGAFWTS